ncbi:MAG: hypothetical protein ACK40Q_01260 [Pseudothermotoga sp.]
MNLTCLIVGEDYSFAEKLQEVLAPLAVKVKILRTLQDVDQIAELIFQETERFVDLLLILGGVDARSTTVSSTAVKRICDERVYTLETHLCQFLAQYKECILTSPTVGVRRRTLIVSLPQHEATLKVLPSIVDVLKGG